MLRKSFGDFVNKKKREAIEQLGLVGQMLEKGGFKVQPFLEGEDHLDDPYVYIQNPERDSSFDGVRIYKIGSQIAFRIQKESKTQPYGKAYPLDIEDMFHDFLSDDDADDDQAAQRVIESVVEEMKRFFKRSAKAEKEIRRNTEFGDPSKGNVIVNSTGTDYSQQIFNRSN